MFEGILNTLVHTKENMMLKTFYRIRLISKVYLMGYKTKCFARLYEFWVCS